MSDTVVQESLMREFKGLTKKNKQSFLTKVINRAYWGVGYDFVLNAIPSVAVIQLVRSPGGQNYERIAQVENNEQVVCATHLQKMNFTQRS